MFFAHKLGNNVLFLKFMNMKLYKRQFEKLHLKIVEKWWKENIKQLKILPKTQNCVVNLILDLKKAYKFTFIVTIQICPWVFFKILSIIFVIKIRAQQPRRMRKVLHFVRVDFAVDCGMRLRLSKAMDLAASAEGCCILILWLVFLYESNRIFVCL